VIIDKDIPEIKDEIGRADETKSVFKIFGYA
jgi:hypothetical protein